MKTAHNIRLSVFAHEEEDAKKIKQAFISLLPFDLEQEKLKLRRTTATGFRERKILILEIMLKKERHTRKFLTFLKDNISEDQKLMIARQAESRLDDELDFFIRLDKQRLLNKEFWVTDSGDCFHIKISVAAYPAKREAALEVVREWLS